MAYFASFTKGPSGIFAGMGSTPNRLGIIATQEQIVDSGSLSE